MWTARGARTLLILLAFAGLAARADEPRKAPAELPDPGFLEFLGSVDRMAEVNPDYLSQADPPTARMPGIKPPPPPPPPPPPRPPPPNAAGDKNND
ncbi:MAG TPA: hypothetical protein VET66_08460 [Steroidobacteraceae bacterium]|nr:hypothetical protein [Steroidobacteraceae bacterium]